MAVTASFDPTSGMLSVFGDALDNTITVSRDAAGTILINGGARLTSQQSTISAQSTLGHGGTIGITSNVLHRDAGSIIDASSQSATNGTVTINGVIQP